MEDITPITARLESLKRKDIRAKAIRVSSEGMVKEEWLPGGRRLPLVIEPAVKELDLIAWARRYGAYIQSRLAEYGAVLFRNFGLCSVASFEAFVRAVSTEVMAYRERSSPRHTVGERVYTSTDYPAHQSIFPHNEHSYSRTVPLRLFFFCLQPASHGGETPLGDCRRVWQRIDRELCRRFLTHGWMYVRNFGEGLGLPWQTVFQTTDKPTVEAYCRENDIAWQWQAGDRLRTWQVRPVTIRHPHTGEEIWFNHATFFHISTLESALGRTLLEEFGTEHLPNNTYYGDGTPIEPAVMEHLRQVYEEEMAPVPWQAGDLVMLDNLLVAHGRRPFAGPRQVLFAMADPYTRPDLRDSDRRG